MPSNRLAKEKSPYLLQHAHNPVDWYPWGEEAFLKAKAEDKPVFLSVGYSTCHWCHVMERESFENPGIAEILNEHFVSVKVDREERPDVDGVYMAVVMAMTGSGGWPMSVFLTAEKKPFYGGTYFPPEARWGSPGFKDILLSISGAWKTRREEILKSGESITGIFRSQSPKKESQGPLDERALDIAYRQFLASFDSVYGGFGQQPKFPTAHNLSFLLRYWKRTGETKAFDMADRTLKSMMRGGIYDHLGGGFHRYSTDQKWHVPHFEKMLYDQALIAKAYLEAYQVTKNKDYAVVAGEIFDYVLRDLKDKDGGFYCAEDADSLPAQGSSEKKEGAFFVWDADEILKILGREAGEMFNFRFGVDKNGNVEFDPHNEFSGKNILYAARTLNETAGHFGKSEGETAGILEDAKRELLKGRGLRPRPHLDDKILTDWNGLMISSLAFGARVLGEARYAEAAEKAAQFILEKLIRADGRLLHRYREGESGILGTIDDYAFLIHGLVDLYQATFKTGYLARAGQLAAGMMELFWDKHQGGFFFSGFDAEQILFPQKEIYDGAVPSGNAVTALELIRLSRLTGQGGLEDTAKKIFDCFSGEVLERASGYSQMLMALGFALGPSKEIVISGDFHNFSAQEMIKYVNQEFLPEAVVLFRPAQEKYLNEIAELAPFVKEQTPVDGRPTAYVCRNHACRLPVTEISRLKAILDQKE